MKAIVPHLVLAWLATGASGCDSELRECSPSEAQGSQVDACLRSVFKVDNVRYLEASGVVRRGERGVAGAVVRVEPFDLGAGLGPSVTTVTNEAGQYGPIAFVPYRYTLSVRLERDVIAVRDLAYRYFEATIEAEGTSDRPWSWPLDVRLTRPVAPDHALAFFVSGDGTWAVRGDVERGLFVEAREFTGKFTLHAIEYSRGTDLSSATAYGRIDGNGSASGSSFVTLDLVPLDPKSFGDVNLQPIVPPGFTTSEIEIIVAYSPTSYGRLTTLTAGVTKRFPFLPSTYHIAYRASARANDGATVNSGVVPFDPFAKDVRIALPSSVHAVVSPADGTMARPDASLVTSGNGVLEHVLDGEDRTIRIVGRGGAMALPDLSALGLDPPRGRYTWRVRSYPKVSFVENLSGPNGRRFQPVATSAPRTITFE
jgi:hypothetical protein